MNLRWKFIYLGRRPSPSPLLSPDALADVVVVDLKLSNIRRDSNRNGGSRCRFNYDNNNSRIYIRDG